MPVMVTARELRKLAAVVREVGEGGAKRTTCQVEEVVPPRVAVEVVRIAAAQYEAARCQTAQAGGARGAV